MVIKNKYTFNCACSMAHTITCLNNGITVTGTSTIKHDIADIMVSVYICNQCRKAIATNIIFDGNIDGNIDNNVAVKDYDCFIMADKD
jgi:hypothetical protein